MGSSSCIRCNTRLAEEANGNLLANARQQMMQHIAGSMPSATQLWSINERLTRIADGGMLCKLGTDASNKRC